jgi:hypothetical protein
MHLNVPIRRYSATRRFFLQVFWTIFTFLAPEFMLYIPINERINASILLEKVLRYHPHLAEPGVLARMYIWIRGRVNVSAQCQSTVIH